MGELKLLLSKARSLVRSLFSMSECFTIDVSVQEGRPLVERGKKSVFRFKQSKWWSLSYPTIMKADPFLFAGGGQQRLHLFYEEMCIGRGLGVIKHVYTDDLRVWSKPELITNEPECHFSYPFVFEDHGSVYMMPETGCDHNIRLYKAVDDNLSEFVRYKVILEREQEKWASIKYDFADSCVYKKGGLYYLFTSYFDGANYYLELYVADALEGPYTLHKDSPICTGTKFARCAGSLIEKDGQLYRPAQDCTTVYGGQVHLLQIDTLSPTAYKEHIIKENVLPEGLSLYREGGHQLNFAEFGGRTVVATDARYLCSFFLERLRLRLKKIVHI